MANHDGENQPISVDTASAQSNNDAAAPVEQEPSTSRTDLVQRARSFLTSPQIRHQDISSKRRFLSEKGLTETEVNSLLQELLPQIPLVPPRTYPQLPPSNLPSLLAGLVRIFTWLTGGSAVVLFIYYRFLLPRLTRSAQARLSLKLHQRDLFSKLTDSITTLRTTQSESFSSLPRPIPFKELVKYKDCHSLDEVADLRTDDAEQIQDLTLLRCGIEQISQEKKVSNTEELFLLLRSKITWVAEEEWPQYEGHLWETLSTHPAFCYSERDNASVWSYVPPVPPDPSPLMSSIEALKASLPSPRRNGRFQHTMDALSDFTGYITTQTYALPSGGGLGMHLGGGIPLGPQEEEVRKEIRALKGLVLNRRSFMPTIPKVNRSSTLGTSVTPVN